MPGDASTFKCIQKFGIEAKSESNSDSFGTTFFRIWDQELMLKSYDRQPKKEIKKMDYVDDDEMILERLTSEVVKTLKELRKVVENKLA